MIFRTAKLYDAEMITQLINYFAQKGLMLKRTTDEVIANIRNFLVAVEDNQIVGSCAVSFFSLELAEIRSLAVAQSFQGMGIGKKLVAMAEEIIREEGVKSAFVLTRKPDFFSNLGYKIVPKSKFPQKIWRDCVGCPNLMKCDEVAMEKELA